ncbi:hypothetical protein GGX14DRAFT_460880 [Mycena pura]|uniref:DUF6532 domain-containing protein n=1 Tax=Mycena pura TaxID=153505 RepID=A0AAD6VAD5_9AGAR|nr:hypothetical protein GGX14DRAFT_460880 [Mycena pura]
MSGNEQPTFMSNAIKALTPVTLPQPRIANFTVRRTKSTTARISPNQYALLPEPTAEQRQLDMTETLPASPAKSINAGGDDDDGMESAPMSTPSPVDRGRQWSPGTVSSKRPLSPASSVVPPPAKRVKGPKLDVPFCAGFVRGPGVKPKASDYDAVGRALILRSCADYTARILSKYAFPSVMQQGEWAKQSFSGACRSAGERFVLSPRISKIIIARGSQARGKIIEAFRALFASYYGFVRSTNAKTIAANKDKAANLLHKSAFHYKNTATRTGYAEQKIVADVREAKVFKDKGAVGIIFSSYFNPIPLELIALEIAALEFCTKEWATGSFISAKFFEKDVAEAYAGHLADTEKWHKVNELVVDNLRHKWYRRASRTLTNTLDTDKSGNMDEDQENTLRDELAGRTGETDSEAEAE